jgi:DNA-binding beta-propeller fold protein YncE
MRRLFIALSIAVLAPRIAIAQPTIVFQSRWQVLPAGFAGFGPVDVAVAPNGTVLVSDFVRVRVFTSGGTPLGEWLLPPVGINAHGTPGLMAIDDAGNAFIPAGFGYVQKLTLGGSLLSQWRLQGSNNAFGIAIGSDGTVFVSDPSNRNIQRFTPDGQFLLRWGAEGMGPGQFFSVSGIAADRAGRVYALDSGTNHRVEVFDLNGNFLFEWGSQGSGDGQFEALTDIAVGASGNIFISDEQLKRVQEFRPDGGFVGIVGSQGPGEGQFVVPAGMGTDGVGNLFVADLLGHWVDKFGPAAVASAPISWGRIKANYRGL